MGKLKGLKFDDPISIKIPKIQFEDDDSKAFQKAAKSALTQGIIRGVERIKGPLALALDQALGDPVWNWDPKRKTPGVDTQRKNGEIAGGTRDIVDTGHLASTLQLKESFLVTKAKIDIIYKAPYANMVYYGGAIQPYGNPKADTAIVPGRPWIKAVIEGTHGIESIKPELGRIMMSAISETWAAKMGEGTARQLG